MSKDVECPYCEEWNEICHDDGFGYDEDRAHEMECDHCGKNFVFHTSISFHYEAGKADCLNGDPHNFREWVFMWLCDGSDESLFRRGCRDCDHVESKKFKRGEDPNS